MTKQQKNLQFTSLSDGDGVRIKPISLGDKVCKRSTIHKQLDERSYDVEAEFGRSCGRELLHHLPPALKALSVPVFGDLECLAMDK